MDIKHLTYFIEIINCDYNVSQASKKLNISQPALSAAIKSFEVENSMALFERHKGRLVSLTPAGDVFYRNALDLLEAHQRMMSELREGSLKLKGKVRVGVPPLILGIAFFHAIPKVVLENPDIQFEIIEAGAFELRKKLQARELDFAILLHMPGDPNPNLDEYLLIEDKLDAFMDASNPLAIKRLKNQSLTWEDLRDKPLVTFGPTFMIHHLLMDKFATRNLVPQIAMTSSSWDFLLMAVRNTPMVTVLPAPIAKVIKFQNLVQIPFADPIPWQVSICRPKKSHYNHLETHVLNAILREMSEEAPLESVL